MKTNNLEFFESAKEKVFNLINESAYIDTVEIKESLQMKMQTVTARLSDLEEEGKIHKFSINYGNNSFMWVATLAEKVEEMKAKCWNERREAWQRKGLKNNFISKDEYKGLNKNLKLFR